MPPKTILKSNVPDIREDEDDAEYVVVPPDGGWGWVVVAAAFYLNVVIDGIIYSFSIFLQDIADHFHTEKSKVSLIFSILFGTHFIMGVACAGLSNVFGIRPVTCAGALFSSFAFGISSIMPRYEILYFTYGILGGIGMGLMLMNGLIAPTIYFSKWRGLAVALTATGTGVGGIFFPYIGNQIRKVATWQTAFQAQSVAAASVFLAGLTFRPIKPKRIVTMEDLPPKTLERAKSTVIGARSIVMGARPSSTAGLAAKRTPTVYFQRTVFDSARAQATASSILVPAYALEAAGAQSTMHSWSSGPTCYDKCCDICCPKRCGNRGDEREEDVWLVNPETRSELFRDELLTDYPFRQRAGSIYSGQLQRVQSKFKSTLSFAPAPSTYMFSKAPTSRKEKPKFCDPLVASLKNMLNCKVLKSPAYVVFAVTGATSAAGLIIVMTYQPDRAVLQGFSPDMATYFVMTLGGANTVWRLFLGFISVMPRVNHLRALVLCTILGGIATAVSGLNLSVTYQFMFSITVGLALAAFAVLRPVIMVELVGLELVANATGIKFVMMGIGAILGPPLSGLVMEATDDYDATFYIGGALIIGSGFVVSTVWYLRDKESQRPVPKAI